MAAEAVPLDPAVHQFFGFGNIASEHRGHPQRDTDSRVSDVATGYSLKLNPAIRAEDCEKSASSVYAGRGYANSVRHRTSISLLPERLRIVAKGYREAESREKESGRAALTEHSIAARAGEPYPEEAFSSHAVGDTGLLHLSAPPEVSIGIPRITLLRADSE